MKKLGFGCMRLPMTEGKVDGPRFEEMVDRYLAEGFCYFDTAHVYLDGQSETALRAGLVRRHRREAFFLTDKLSGSCYNSREDIRPLFQRQLDACGVEYFDGYLLHALSAPVYEKATRCGAFEEVARLKEEGLVRHVGISFHDKPEVLARILTDHPEIEAVQIQLNYMDMDDPVIDSRGVYEVCRAFQKPVLVMEPVKGGALAQLPPAGEEVFSALGQASPASYALRYAAGFPGVEMVLSGMGTLAQLEDNMRALGEPRPLDQAEMAAVERVQDILRAENAIPCTACRYCTAGCPKHIPIPDIFACLNGLRRYRDWPSEYYCSVSVRGQGQPDECVACGQCERACPQHLPIIQLLRQAGEEFRR